uniref:GPI inositol-deacylase n=1 Tax=Rhabditophanes sp. KR3021 TaxID=114890 RepID=A0AC35TWV9_9BILA
MGYLLVKILKMGLILGLGRYFVYDDLMEYKEFTKHSCAMTSMWRVPQLLPLFEDVSTNYKVSLYGEGEYLKKSYEADYLDGIPVIYIPGNKASAQQARSLGSLLQNKTETRKSTFHFNVFAVDFNEEINIFSSSILRREATFLIDIMFKLDSLYDPLINPNKKYIIVSHSMGGIVARMAARSCEKFKSKLSMIVSLGTPHKHSPMMITKDIVNEWKYMQQLKDVPVISIGGGLLDFQIEETLIKEGHIMAYNLQTVDRAWTMADHQCLVWCNQLQRAISRLLFDYASLDPSKTSNSVIHKLAQKNFNSSTLSYPSLALPDSSLVGLDKDLLSNSAFIFSIRKTNTKHDPTMTIVKARPEIIREKARVNSDTVRCFLSEFFGTFLLVFIGLCINSQFILRRGTVNAWINVNLGWAMAIIFCVMITAKASGAHLNPAISFMFYSFGNLTLAKMFIYFAAQFSGAFVGAMAVYGYYNEAINHFDGGVRAISGINETAGIFASYPAAYVSFTGAFIDQIVGTGILALFVVAIIDPRNEIPGHLHAVLFGGVVVMIGCAFGMNLGYPINPARDLAPRLFTFFTHGSGVFSHPYNYYWIAPVFAPFVGALLGGWLYYFFIGFHIEDPSKKEYLPITLAA